MGGVDAAIAGHKIICKNLSKIACQAPQPSKITSTTRKQKRKNLPASGIVVMLEGI
jgi:hypothetical protein